MGIFALSSSSPRAEKQGRGWHMPAAALGRRPVARERLWSEGGGRVRSPVAARPEAARDGLATTAGGSGRRVALGRRPRGVVAVKGGGGKHWGTRGLDFPRSPWIGMEREGRSTKGRRGGGASLRRRRCVAWERARGGGGGCGAVEWRGGSLYRASKAVERCGAGGRLASIAGRH